MLPEKDRRDDVAVSRLDQVSNREGPFTDLACFELKLIGEVDDYGLERVFSGDLQLDLH